MATTDANLTEIWTQIVADVDSPSGTRSITAMQRSFLKMARLAAVGGGFAVITAPSDAVRRVIEHDLRDNLCQALERHLQEPYQLAVTVSPSAEEVSQPPLTGFGLRNPAQVPADKPAPKPEPEPEPVEHIGAHSLPEPAATQDPAPTSESAEPVPAEPDAPAHTAAHTTPEHTAAEYTAAAPTPAPPAPEPEPEPETSPADPTPLTGTTPTVTLPPPQTAQRFPRERPAHNPNRDQSLNQAYTFDTFVIGKSNRFAHAAAIAVAESPAAGYNPLFIWGGSGLGKTHLLHAIGNYAQELQPNLRVLYVSSEEFTNDYINSVRDDRQEKFKRRYRNLDVLMVDDIQFLQGKEGTQEEFFHTFNALYQANKQIVLSSDRAPKMLTTLEDRLSTRFAAGLTTDVQPPDLETRIAILSKKAQLDGTKVPREVLELIASRFEDSIRELEGALIRVTAYSTLTNERITVDTAYEALREIMPDESSIEITANSIMEITADYFGIELGALQGTGRNRAVAHPRQLAMYLCRELTDLSLPKIGGYFGGKDHTTVMYADRKIRKEMAQKTDTYQEIQELTRRIKSGGHSHG